MCISAVTFCSLEEALGKDAIPQFKRLREAILKSVCISFQADVFLSCSTSGEGDSWARLLSDMAFCSETQQPPARRQHSRAKGSVVCLYAMCFASCNNENQGSLHKRLCCCSQCCWDNKARREKQPKREGICFRLAVPMTVHPGKEVTMAGGRMSWSHGIPKQMLQAYAQLAFPGY